MLKKLLSISLAAVMLLASVSVMAADVTLTADMESLVENTYDSTAFEELYVITPGKDATVANDYRVVQKFMGDTNSIGDYTLTNKWWVAKVYIGKNWSFDSAEAAISMTAQVRTYNGDFTFYGIPVSVEEFEAAKAAATNKTEHTTFTQPALAPAPGTNTWSDTNTNDHKTTRTVNFVPSQFTEENYKDGYIYVAYQAVRTDAATLQPRYFLTANEYSFYVKGTREQAADIAETTAIFVNADNKAATENTLSSKTGSDITQVGGGDWAVYKFALGETYEDVSSVSLSFNADYMKEGFSYVGVHLYLLTEAQYNAYAANVGKTLKLADKQNLFTKPLGNMTRFAYQRVNYSAHGSGHCAPELIEGTDYNYALNFTFTDAGIKEQAKSGNVYLAICAAMHNTITNEDYSANITIPTLSVKGSKGAFEETKANDFSDTVLMWDGTDNSYDVYTQTESGEACLIAATFNGVAMVDAELVPVDAAGNVNGVISGNVPALDEGTTLKIYLWKAGTLAPITNVIEFTQTTTE